MTKTKNTTTKKNYYVPVANLNQAEKDKRNKLKRDQTNKRNAIKKAKIDAYDELITLTNYDDTQLITDILEYAQTEIKKHS